MKYFNYIILFFWAAGISCAKSGESGGLTPPTTPPVSQAWLQQAYIKAANAGAGDQFSSGIAISGDTMVIAANGEASNQTTITNGTGASADNSASAAGAVYVYRRTGSTWVQEAYLKAHNTESNDVFGWSVAISGDTIVVGADGESSNDTTISAGASGGANNAAGGSGAVYVFKRTGNTWAQEAFIKAANAGAGDGFGSSVGISGDTIVVGAPGEDSNVNTVTNGTTASADNSLSSSGAAYVYKRTGNTWAQEAFLKASNPGSLDIFGSQVAISGDTIAVGAERESSNGSSQADNSASQAGAVYVFKRMGVNWAQEAYVKAPNPTAADKFGYRIALSGDTLAVGAFGEDSNQTSITNGATATTDDSVSDSGAVYVFKRSGVTWTQEAYIKASNAETNDQFGISVALDGDILVVGSSYEDSADTTISNSGVASADNSKPNSGAAYVFKRSGSTWTQSAFVKAANSDTLDEFANTIAISGNTIVVGAIYEDSNVTTITHGTVASSNNGASNSGAAYVYSFQ